jgi:hypothetical protein
MKTTQRKPGRRHFSLKILAYGNSYYIERTVELEKALARKPRRLQIDLAGAGEIPGDMALLIRSILLGRWPKTQIITRARSSLQNGSVLVWLLGDQRIIRDDARLFFRPAALNGDDDEIWQDKMPKLWKPASETDPEEHDHARVLELINEFLPVKELAGQIVGLPVLRQFGLVENEKLDRFLTTMLEKGNPEEIKRNRAREETKAPQK